MRVRPRESRSLLSAPRREMCEGEGGVPRDPNAQSQLSPCLKGRISVLAPTPMYDIRGMRAGSEGYLSLWYSIFLMYRPLQQSQAFGPVFPAPGNLIFF